MGFLGIWVHEALTAFCWVTRTVVTILPSLTFSQDFLASIVLRLLTLIKCLGNKKPQFSSITLSLPTTNIILRYLTFFSYFPIVAYIRRIKIFICIFNGNNHQVTNTFQIKAISEKNLHLSCNFLNCYTFYRKT